jgi:hypothetical protein
MPQQAIQCCINAVRLPCFGRWHPDVHVARSLNAASLHIWDVTSGWLHLPSVQAKKRASAIAKRLGRSLKLNEYEEVRGTPYGQHHPMLLAPAAPSRSRITGPLHASSDTASSAADASARVSCEASAYTQRMSLQIVDAPAAP